MGPTTKSIGIIVTSHRAVRLGPSVGALVHDLLQPAAQAASISLKTVDVRKFNLPIFEGPLPPKAMAGKGIQHEQEGPRAWAEEMASLDGYIFVMNEYNGSFSGAAKNAIDYLWGGFVEKPAAVVSYGSMGGPGANAQTRALLAAMGLTVVEPPVELAFSGGIGPDAFLAVGKGEIGEDSKKAWTTEKAGDLLKAFGQLEAELKKEKAASSGTN